MARPNIVFIITDQQRHDTIKALGHDHMITPNLDRMVEEGIAFTRMYCTSPVCSPSRASLFSGLYPHSSGVLRNDERWPYTWVHLLAEAGYRCVNVGKMHTHPFEEAFGFHERHVTENKDRAHPNLPFYLDNWDKALWAAGYIKPSRQTFASRRLQGPPSPSSGSYRRSCIRRLLAQAPSTGSDPAGRGALLPASRHSGPHRLRPDRGGRPLYDGVSSQPIRNYDLSQPTAVARCAKTISRNDHDAVVHLADPAPDSAAPARPLRQRHHDRPAARPAEGGLSAGCPDNTVIIFTGHGDSLNDHGHSQKWSMFESSVRVPCLIHDRRRSDGGRRIDDLTSLFDLGPTILELAGVTPPAWMEAQSLVPYFDRDTDPARDTVYAELADDMIQQDCPFITMIRTGKWKLVHYLGSDEGQLFDLEPDPDESNNLWDAPAHQTTRQELTHRILAWRLQSARHTQRFLVDALAG